MLCLCVSLSPSMQELCQEVPGLFSLGPKGELLVGQARQHERQLEKVRDACRKQGGMGRGEGAGARQQPGSNQHITCGRGDSCICWDRAQSDF